MRHGMRHGQVSMNKAKEILRHGSVRGHRLTRRQRGFLGARAGGSPLRGLRRRRREWIRSRSTGHAEQPEASRDW